MAVKANDLDITMVGPYRLPITQAQGQSISDADRAKFNSVTLMRTELTTNFGYTNAQLDIMSKLDIARALAKKLNIY